MRTRLPRRIETCEVGVARRSASRQLEEPVKYATPRSSAMWVMR